MRSGFVFLSGALTGSGIALYYQSSKPDAVVLAEKRRRASIDGPVTVYGFAVSPPCHKLYSFMKYHGIPFEKVEVTPPGKEEILFSPNYKKVPIAFVKGYQVNDSAEILRQLEGIVDGKSPAAAKESAIVTAPPRAHFTHKIDDTVMPIIDTEVLGALEDAMFSGYGSAKALFSRYGTQSAVLTPLYSFIAPRMVLPRIKAGFGELADASRLEPSITKALKQGGVGPKQRFIGGKSPSASDLALYGMLDLCADVPSVVKVMKSNSGVREWYDAVGSAVAEKERYYRAKQSS